MAPAIRPISSTPPMAMANAGTGLPDFTAAVRLLRARSTAETVTGTRLSAGPDGFSSDFPPLAGAAACVGARGGGIDPLERFVQRGGGGVPVCRFPRHHALECVHAGRGEFGPSAWIAAVRFAPGWGLMPLTIW